MMAGNPNWWSMHPPAAAASLIPQYVLGSSSSSSSSSSSIPFNSLTEHQDPPQSWSQLLFTGLPGEEERVGFSHFLQVESAKNNNNWDHNDEQFLDPSSRSVPSTIDDVIKQEVPQISGNNRLYGHVHHEELFHHHPTSAPSISSWSSHHMLPLSSSPTSCITTSLSSNNNNNMLDFTYNKPEDHRQNNQLLPDQTSSECNSSTLITGGVCKKARVQPSSTQPHLKVRKEKLGDRITALHQLVSPFGKTDTASVLLEAIGYIRFLQGQIEALSSPYLDTASKNNRNHQHSAVVTVQGHGERNSVFPEDPGQLLNDNNGLKRKGAPNQQDVEEKAKDLKSRGLCLVPVSCTQHVGSENGADYWAPAFGSGF